MVLCIRIFAAVALSVLLAITLVSEASCTSASAAATCETSGGCRGRDDRPNHEFEEHERDSGHQAPPHHHSHDHGDHGHHHHTSDAVHDHSACGNHQPLSPWLKWSNAHPQISAIVASLAISGSAFIVTPFIPFLGSNRGYSLLKLMNAFSVGGLLGDVFLHIIPHSAARLLCVGHDHGDHVHSGNELQFAVPLLSGSSHHDILFLMTTMMMPTFYNLCDRDALTGESLTRSFQKNKRQSPEVVSDAFVSSAADSVEVLSRAKVILLVLADLLHNFTDGLALGVSWRLGRGRSTTVAVFMHEVPHNMADFALLVGQRMPTLKALKLQFITALGTVAGAFCGSLAIVAAGPWLDLFVGGGFMYLALCNIVPALVQTNHVSMLDAITQVAFGLCIQACVIAVMVHAFNSWSTSRVSLARFNESLQCAGICAGVWLMVVMLQFEDGSH